MKRKRETYDCALAVKVVHEGGNLSNTADSVLSKDDGAEADNSVDTREAARRRRRTDTLSSDSQTTVGDLRDLFKRTIHERLSGQSLHVPKQFSRYQRLNPSRR